MLFCLVFPHGHTVGTFGCVISVENFQQYSKSIILGDVFLSKKMFWFPLVYAEIKNFFLSHHEQCCIFLYNATFLLLISCVCRHKIFYYDFTFFDFFVWQLCWILEIYTGNVKCFLSHFKILLRLSIKENSSWVTMVFSVRSKFHPSYLLDVRLIFKIKNKRLLLLWTESPRIWLDEREVILTPNKFIGVVKFSNRKPNHVYWLRLLSDYRMVTIAHSIFGGFPSLN